jgi:hypothetical protein
MDPSVVIVWLTGEVDVGPSPGLGKLGNMSLGAKKKRGSVRCKRAVLAGVHGVGAKGENGVEWTKAIASKLAPTLVLCTP